MATWSVPIRSIVEIQKSKVDKTLRRAIGSLFYRVVMASPVDTGRFRANWNVSWATPNLSVSTSTSDASVQSAITELRTGRGKVDGVVYLTNNLAYAGKLEHGYSAQAPSGMVKVAVAEWDEILRASIKE